MLRFEKLNPLFLKSFNPDSDKINNQTQVKGFNDLSNLKLFPVTVPGFMLNIKFTFKFALKNK